MGFGFIHEELDIKILILFILRRLPGWVELDTLMDLCRCDEGPGYFDYAAGLAELVDNGHIEQDGTRYRITEKGDRNGEIVESSLPYSVRNNAQRLIDPIANKMRRDNMIKTEHKMTDAGLVTTLSMADSMGTMISMDLLCADEAQAKKIEKNFRQGAEGYYHEIISMLSKD